MFGDYYYARSSGGTMVGLYAETIEKRDLADGDTVLDGITLM